MNATPDQALFNPGWTPERLAELRKLWDQGLTCSQIAVKLGYITRNAVIGKAHRLQFPKRAADHPRPISTEKVEAERRRQLRVRDARRKANVRSNIIRNNLAMRRQDPRLPKEIVDTLTDTAVPLLEIGALQCHFIIGDPVPNALMCGAPTDGRRYCPHHHARTHLRTDTNTQHSQAWRLPSQ